MKYKTPQFRADRVLFLEKTDDRWPEYRKQLEERGFADSELYNLDWTIACFILPRIKAFKKEGGGYPGRYKSSAEWKRVLNKMIKALESIVEGKNNDSVEEEGLKLLFEKFHCLWN